MKKGILFLLIPMFLLSVACKRNVTHGKGVSGADTCTVGGFTAVMVSAPVHAIIKIDNTAQPGVELSGYQNLLALIKTEVKGNTLHIYTDELVHFKTDKDVIANITVPSLMALEISGAAETNVTGKIAGDNFDLDVNGAGDVSIENISSNSFSANLSGAGSLNVKSGEVNKAVYDITGAGEVAAYPLLAHHVIANVTGAGDMEVNAAEKLDVHITGAGEISYKGHPAITKDVAGAGDLEDAN